MFHDLHPCRHPDLPARLRDETERATAVVLERVLEEIPLYRTLDPVQLADVRETVRIGYEATLELWAAGRLAAPEQLPPFRDNGATRAAEGRPLPLVLRAYRVSGLGIYDYVVDHPEVRLDPEEERNFARLTMAFVDQLSNEVTLGYVETTGQLANQQGRARREFLEDLLAGRLLGAAEVDERASTLGLVLPRSPRLIVAAPRLGDGSGLVDHARIALRELDRSHQADDDTPFRLQLITRGQLVLIDQAADPAHVRRALDAAGLTGVVLTVENLVDLAGAYQQARHVHEYLRTAVVSAGTVVAGDEASLLAVLAKARGDALTKPATSAILGDLLTPAHAVLLETLDAYFLTGNSVSAAHRLGVHAQTMRYRLKRIREITGRDPGLGWDRFLLETALRLSDRPDRVT
ncbi:hypothetical protein DSM112329_03860 [Paraconexibacter sp. AEG42_29]|uniref:PucR family transcriptional regulator n=1 Tax=Paraconexibacter sp. AEG42_29 TaxID=2997339 RepID=A0AAU7B005_9ACTN